jgi:regulatory protein
VKRAKPPPDARAVAVRLLARREYGRHELLQRLLQRGTSHDEATAALDDLERRGLLSDARYAEALVTQMRGRYARRAIVRTLRERGVRGEAVEGAGDALATIDDEADARAILVRRFPDPPADDRSLARQVRFLESRGYPLALILRIVRRRDAPDDRGDAG